MYNSCTSHTVTDMQANGVQALFQISTVSAMTGVNAVTLRAWERRYGLLRPLRTDSGHRLYTEDDVERIRAILGLLDQGITISRVGPALDPGAKPAGTTDNNDPGPWRRYRDSMLAAVAAFDEAKLEALYNETMSLYPVDVVTRRLLLPLLESLGERWSTEPGGIAEEHFFSVFLRNKLGGRFHHRNLQNNGPKLVAACLPGEQHEFGLLLFALAAHTRGYRLVLLGANMPLEELPHVVRRTGSAGIVLSGSATIDETALASGLKSLTADIAVPVFAGGSCAQRNRELISACGVTPIGDDLVAGLRDIARRIPVGNEF